MRTVWKYIVPRGSEGPLAPVPCKGKLLHVAIDPASTSPAIWIEVDTDFAMEERRFGFFGTGHPIPEGWAYVGTAHSAGGFVWHVYAVPTEFEAATKLFG